VCGSAALAVEAAGSATRISIARSALLTLDAIGTDAGLALRIRRANDQGLINSNDVTVAIDGRNQPLKRQADGTFLVSTPDVRGAGEREIEVVVGHDGIREVLTGKVSLPEATATTSLLRDHKQQAWWILNVVIVIIAAVAWSRRKSARS
jgi:hypothetical protein